jgi:alpha-aminoadipate/glutamate carrier protein LysW
MATCPVCDAEDLELDEYEVDEGDVVNCPECGASLEVSSVSPLEFEAVSDEDEDDEDDDEDDDDEDDEEEDEREDWDE